MAGSQRLPVLRPQDAVLLEPGRSGEGGSVPISQLGKTEQHIYPGGAEGISHPRNVLGKNQTEVHLHPDQVQRDTCG